MTVYKWSQTAASNSNADGTINWAEGQAPSTVNDSARALMAAIAKYRDDNSGSLTTGGSSTAYTVTSNQVFASLSVMSGQTIRVKMHTTCGASPTLNVDGLGAKSIVTVTGSAVGTGSLLANTIYQFVYSNSSSEWIVVGGASLLGGFPSATVMLFVQTAAPTGWTKSTSFDNYALRVVSGSVTSGGTTNFSSVFTSRTIAQANLPNVNFTVSATNAWPGTVPMGVAHGTSPALTVGAGGGATFSSAQFTDISVPTITGTAASGGSGTALDFAVKFLDVIIATKD